MNWIYFRRRFADIGVIPLFVSLRASYAEIIEPRRGRVFSPAERNRIQVMIAQGYGDRAFSDQVIDTGKADFQTTLSVLESKVRAMLTVQCRPPVPPAYEQLKIQPSRTTPPTAPGNAVPSVRRNARDGAIIFASSPKPAPGERH